MNQGRIAHTLKARSGFLGRFPVRISLAHAVPFEVFRSASAAVAAYSVRLTLTNRQVATNLSSFAAKQSPVTSSAA